MRIGQTHQKDREVHVPYFQTDDGNDACIVVADPASRSFGTIRYARNSLVKSHPFRSSGFMRKGDIVR